MEKYGDQDEKYLEEKIAEIKKRPDGEKTAEEAAPLEKLLEQTKKNRIREDD